VTSRFAVISTFPPTPCGIATFSAALSGALTRRGDQVTAVRVDEGGRVDGTHLTACGADVVILQHEYGLYSGLDGDSVVDLARGVDTPLIVVAHTVLRRPTRRQREVLDAVVEAADAVVAMTSRARQLLVDDFGVDDAKVVVIPHGAAVAQRAGKPDEPAAREVLTWGLLGPGKGIEWAIDAVEQLTDLSPPVTYRIAGDTHPKVARTDGDAYRDMLRRRTQHLGLTDRVTFDAGYRSTHALEGLIASAAVVVLPYDSPDQVTSGVLVDAVAAGRPVVATAFPHAVELLATGAGMVVPRHDPDALAAALRRIFTVPGVAAAMATEARRLAPGLAWSAVAARYADLGRSLTSVGAVPA
jgi:glycosyltransferase involved in cell wall biosynthesis